MSNHLRIKVEKATFSAKAKKVQLSFNSLDGQLISKTNLLHAKKGVTEAVWNELIEIEVDPNQGLEIVLDTSKSNTAIQIDKLSKLKLTKGEPKPFPLGFDIAKVDLTWTALDFGLAPKKTPKKISVSSKIQSTPSLPDGGIDESDIERQFEEVVRNTNLKAEHIKNMDIHQKINLIQSFQTKNTANEGVEGKPQHWVHKLKAEANSHVVKELLFHIRSKGVDWLEKFHELGGLHVLCELLDKKFLIYPKDVNEEDIAMKVQLITLLDKIMNSPRGLDLIKQTKGSINALALGFCDSTLDEETRLNILKLLTFAAHSPGGLHSLVLSAFSYYRDKMKEKHRFETLVSQLRKCDHHKFEVAYMKLINALVSAPQDVHHHIQVRQELNRLGFKQVLQKLRGVDIEECEELDGEVEAYDDEATHDENIQKGWYEHLGDIGMMDFDNLEWAWTKVKHIKDEAKLETYLRNILADLAAIDPRKEEGHIQLAIAACFISQVATGDYLGDEDSVLCYQEDNFLFKLEVQPLLRAVAATETRWRLSWFCSRRPLRRLM